MKKIFTSWSILLFTIITLYVAQKNPAFNPYFLILFPLTLLYTVSVTKNELRKKYKQKSIDVNNKEIPIEKPKDYSNVKSVVLYPTCTKTKDKILVKKYKNH